MNIRESLPSKKFQKIALVVIILSVVFIFISIKKPFSGGGYVQKIFKGEVETVTIGSIVYKDTDGDGLFDWEESLWGTDPEKSDTDGDGISDKEEVDKKRPETSEGGDESLTETSLLARDLFSTIVSLKQNNSLTEENLESIANQLAGSINSATYDTYTLDSLIVVDSNNNSFIKYFKETDKIFLASKNSHIGEELSVLTDFIEDPTSNQSKLEVIISEYKKISSDLSKLDIPESISKDHLALINTYDKIAQSIEEFLYINDDPLRTLSGLSNYERYSTNILDIFKRIDSYYLPQ